MMVQMALTAADILAEEGISVRVIDMHTIKPLDTEILLAAARDTGCIVTSEEANIVGGLGSAVSEYLTSAALCPSSAMAWRMSSAVPVPPRRFWRPIT